MKLAKITLMDISFIYVALINQNKQLADEIFIKLVLDLKNPPFVLEEKELALI